MLEIRWSWNLGRFAYVCVISWAEVFAKPRGSLSLLSLRFSFFGQALVQDDVIKSALIWLILAILRPLSCQGLDEKVGRVSAQVTDGRYTSLWTFIMDAQLCKRNFLHRQLGFSNFCIFYFCKLFEIWSSVQVQNATCAARFQSSRHNWISKGSKSIHFGCHTW